jgi:hypothetical protein
MGLKKSILIKINQLLHTINSFPYYYFSQQQRYQLYDFGDILAQYGGFYEYNQLMFIIGC